LPFAAALESVPSMVSITALLSRASEHVGSLVELSVVPLVLAALSLDKFRRVAASTADFRVGISFGLPSTVGTAWDFLSLPSAGPGVNLPTQRPETTVLVMVAVAVFSALLGAGYLGSIRRELAGLDRAFLADARTYFGPFLGFELIRLVLVLAGVGAALVAVPLAVLPVVALFVFGYLFYATPYLVVVEGLDLPVALRRSYGYATDGGEYATFFVQYLLAAGAVSVAATPLFTTSVAGAAVGTVVLAPVALLFNTATMLFVRDLTGASDRSTAGESGDPGTGPRGTDADAAGAGQSNMPVET